MNDPKKSVGIVIRKDNGWAAGQYYVEQILIGLLRSKIIDITVLTDEDESPNWSVPELQNASLKYRKLDPDYHLIERLLNTCARMIFGKNAIEKRINSDEFDMIFPIGKADEYPFQLANHVVYWIPDFQDNHYPENFSKEELAKRKLERSKIANSENLVVLSSNSALADFKRFYPNQSCRTFVLPFRVHHKSSNYSNNEVLEKYQLKEGDYFMCPNQFWKHKNHLILIKAINYIKQTTPATPVTILFSGKESGFANEGAAVEAKQLVDELELNDRVKFLGFIDRADLLTLMSLSAAVLQPSLFEGWNTSIEDAQSLGSLVLASKIPVHEEQLEPQFLIDPNSEADWAEAMISVLNKDLSRESDYESKQGLFAQQLVELVNRAGA